MYLYESFPCEKFRPTHGKLSYNRYIGLKNHINVFIQCVYMLLLCDFVYDNQNCVFMCL